MDPANALFMISSAHELCAGDVDAAEWAGFEHHPATVHDVMKSLLPLHLRTRRLTELHVLQGVQKLWPCRRQAMAMTRNQPCWRHLTSDQHERILCI